MKKLIHMINWHSVLVWGLNGVILSLIFKGIISLLK